MNLKSMIAVVAVAAASMVVSVTGASALTVIHEGIIANGETRAVGPINIANNRTRVEAASADQFNGSGTLTIDTYVDPFAEAGLGSANVNFAGSASSVTGDWGGVAMTFSFDAITGTWTAAPITTVFTGSGVANSQLLTLSWTGADPQSQISVTVEAVPLPAGILLMGTALAGFGVMRRRKTHA